MICRQNAVGFIFLKKKYFHHFGAKCLMTSSLNKFELQARDGQCVLLFTKKKIKSQAQEVFQQTKCILRGFSPLKTPHSGRSIFSQSSLSPQGRLNSYVCVCSVCVQVKVWAKGGWQSHFTLSDPSTDYEREFKCFHSSIADTYRNDRK